MTHLCAEFLPLLPAWPCTGINVTTKQSEPRTTLTLAQELSASCYGLHLHV